MNKIGILQGRLSPRPFPKLQAFPASSWKQEFDKAKKTGYDYIEWIFETNAFEENPLWTADGRKQIRSMIKNSDLPVASVCADYFLEKPFFRRTGYSLTEQIDKMKCLIHNTADIGAQLILLPVLENAEIERPEEEAELYKALAACIPELEACDVKIGIESELDKKNYLKLVEGFDSSRVGVYYDAGNCAAKGYHFKEDMEVLFAHLLGVHIKDRLLNGPSVYVGTGVTEFGEGIPYLLSEKYSGGFTMQNFFEHEPEEAAKKCLTFIQKIINEPGENT